MRTDGESENRDSHGTSDSQEGTCKNQLDLLIVRSIIQHMTRGRPKLIDRSTILDTAVDRFWTEGYAGTSVRAIAGACGAGLQSVYNEFGDKEGLFVAALDRYAERQIEERFAPLLLRSPRAIDGLRGLFEFWVEFHSAPDTRGCLLVLTQMEFANDQNAAIAEAARRHAAALEKAILGAVERAQQEGDVPEEREARVIARGLVTMANGIAVLGRAQAPRSFLEDAVKAAARWLE